MWNNRIKEEWLQSGRNLLFDVAGSFLQAIGVWCFIEPCRIAPGGLSGAALLINYLTGLPVGTLTLLLNIPLFVCGFLALDPQMIRKSLRTVVIMTVILDFAVSPFLPQYFGDRLLSSAFGGILVGVGMALIFMCGSTTGGTDILAKLMQRKFPYLRTGYSLMMIDFVIISVSVLVFGELESALYGVLSMVCTTQTIDAILYGMNRGTMVLVNSPRSREIADTIMKRLDRGTTFLNGNGGYSGNPCQVLMCVIDRRQFYLVKEIIDSYDRNAFIVVSETKETYGEGFLDDPRKSRSVSENV